MIEREPTEDDYNVLGCTRKDPFYKVESAYRKLVQKYHPDRPEGDESKFIEIKSAFEVIEAYERDKKARQGGFVQSIFRRRS